MLDLVKFIVIGTAMDSFVEEQIQGLSALISCQWGARVASLENNIRTDFSSFPG